MEPIRIIIADDHEIFLDGLAMALHNVPDIRVVGQVSNGEQLVSLVEKLQPDVVVTDVQMPVMGGREATALIKKRYPCVQVIVLSMFSDHDIIAGLLDAGASGYLVKDAPKKVVFEAIRTVNDGLPYYCRQTTRQLSMEAADKDFQKRRRIKFVQFTETELAIIRYTCKQYRTKEIAAAINLGERTIENYRQRIIEKMNQRTLAGIMYYAIEHGIFKSDDNETIKT